MRFSTKAEYGLKAMVNLAKNKADAKTIRNIAKEENISLKYLERILNILRKNELVVSFKGINGGYILRKPAERINLAQIIVALEGPIAPMKCVGKRCSMEKSCRSKFVWEKVGDQIEKTLKKIKLSDLIK